MRSQIKQTENRVTEPNGSHEQHKAFLKEKGPRLVRVGQEIKRKVKNARVAHRTGGSGGNLAAAAAANHHHTSCPRRRRRVRPGGPRGPKDGGGEALTQPTAQDGREHFRAERCSTSGSAPRVWRAEALGDCRRGRFGAWVARSKAPAIGSGSPCLAVASLMWYIVLTGGASRSNCGRATRLAAIYNG